jgi:hypothetical protein
VILANSYSPNASFAGDMDNIFWMALPNIAAWPTYSLF